MARVSPRNGSRRLSRRAHEALDAHFSAIIDAERDGTLATMSRSERLSLLRMEPELEWLQTEFCVRQLVRAAELADADEPPTCPCCGCSLAEHNDVVIQILVRGNEEMTVCDSCFQFEDLAADGWVLRDQDEDDASSVSSEDSDSSSDSGDSYSTGPDRPFQWAPGALEALVAEAAEDDEEVVIDPVDEELVFSDYADREYRMTVAQFAAEHERNVADGEFRILIVAHSAGGNEYHLLINPHDPAYARPPLSRGDYLLLRPPARAVHDRIYGANLY